MGKFQGKSVLITGGTSGIGRTTALCFAREEAHVVIVGRNLERGQGVVDEIRAEDYSADFLPADVCVASDCRKAVDWVAEQTGALDILFNNAGVFFSGSVAEMPESQWDITINTNLKSVFLFSSYAIPLMQKQGHGIIINNASDWGLKGGRKAAAYCASKGGVVQITRAMALDHAADNIRINCIAPGDIQTPMLDGEAQVLGVSPETYYAQLGEIYPMARIGTAEEVARAVLFLASDDASFITGAVLSVDGGITA